MLYSVLFLVVLLAFCHAADEICAPEPSPYNPVIFSGQGITFDSTLMAGTSYGRDTVVLGDIVSGGIINLDQNYVNGSIYAFGDFKPTVKALRTQINGTIYTQPTPQQQLYMVNSDYIAARTLEIDATEPQYGAGCATPFSLLDEDAVATNAPDDYNLNVKGVEYVGEGAQLHQQLNYNNIRIQKGACLTFLTESDSNDPSTWYTADSFTMFQKSQIRFGTGVSSVIIKAENINIQKGAEFLNAAGSTLSIENNELLFLASTQTTRIADQVTYTADYQFNVQLVSEYNIYIGSHVKLSGSVISRSGAVIVSEDSKLNFEPPVCQVL